MPQSHIFGSERPHPFVEQHDFVSNGSFLQDFGGQTEATKGIGMKRKDTWGNNNPGAGNFEMEANQFGPSSQKRIKTSMNNEDQLQSWLPSQAETTIDPLAQPTTMQVPNSMVAHMTMSFPPPHEEQTQVPEEKSCDMEIEDCTDMTGAESVTEPCIDDNWKGWSGNCTFDGPWWDNIIGCCHGS
eukprot:Seg2253.2 transcript_id=Seg2253.2/GoldUCD/mRNA.D3Y31 product="hypothetical protein" protein_id=Seg2253.2/GoldUCD/D3Y31